MNFESNLELFEIATQLGDLNASDKAQSDYAEILKSVSQEDKNIEDSYYLQLVKESSQKRLYQSVGEIEKKILNDLNQINQIVNTTIELSQISEQSKISETLDLVFKKVNLAINSIQDSSIYDDLKKQIVKEFRQQVLSYHEYFYPVLAEYEKKQTLSDIVRLIDKIITDQQFKIDESDTLALQQGRTLGSKIDAIDSAEKALQALAYTWQILTVEERDVVFKDANQKLYELFNKKDPSEIQCLIDNNCTGLISKLIIKLGVYPALNDYGLEQIKLTLNQKSISVVDQKIKKIVFE